MANIKAPGKQCNRTAHFAGDPGWHAPESSDVLSSRFPNLDREFLFNRVFIRITMYCKRLGESDWPRRGCHYG